MRAFRENDVHKSLAEIQTALWEWKCVWEREREGQKESLFPQLDERLTSCSDNHIGDTYTTPAIM